MFQKISGETLGDQVARQLAQAIDDGQWVEGDYLPTEFELCRQFQVSRTTVRTALMILAQRGYIQTQRGKGSVVKARRAASSREQIHQARRARCFLEAGAAAFAASHAGEEALDLLEKQHRQCLEAQDRVRYERLLEWGRLLVSFYQSDILNQMHRGLAEACLQGLPEPRELEALTDMQGRVLGYIRAGKPEAAYEAVLQALSE